MKKRILLDALYPEEVRVVVLDGKRILEYDYQSINKKQQKGNIYLAKVTRVEPSLQAAFIDYGGDRHGFLPFIEIHPDYYNIPHADKVSLEKAELPSVSSEEISDESEHSQAEEDNEQASRKKRPNRRNRFNKERPADKEDNSAIATNSESLENSSYPIHQIEEGIDKFDNSQDNERLNFCKQYKIQEVIKKGQVLLVQAIKEERGTKGASFTTFISLAGKYCVLMPNNEKQGGISKKIFDFEDRDRLKKIVDGLENPKGSSVIIRTAGGGKTQAEIQKDFEYLSRLWNSVREHTISSNAPTFIHAEGDLIIRTIRDLYDNDTDEVIIQGDSVFENAKDLIAKFAPSHMARIKKYTDRVPIFTKYNVDSELSQLYNPIAKLESGGYIVINPTEALISIDVNSGKSTSERNIEETALKTNLEAINEISRQLKLRDLSGLIVIDFIDMEDANNRKLVERKLRDAFQYDKARIQIGTISPFGLLEMSRQRIRSSIIEANTIVCPHCTGKGYVRSPEHNAIHILKTVQSEIMEGDFELVNVYAHPDVIVYLINNSLKDILKIEENFDTKIIFNKEYNTSVDSFSIARVKREKKVKVAGSQPTIDNPYSFNNSEDAINYYENPEPKKDNAEFENKNIDEGAFSSKVFKPSQRRYKKHPKKKFPFKKSEFNQHRNPNKNNTNGSEEGSYFGLKSLWKKITS
jgi:ribonuclease E